MSSRSREDWENTKEQLRNPSPPRDGKTWLRHSKIAGLVDQMLLEGRYSEEEIAEAINDMFGFKKIEVRLQKVKDHISHLQDGSEDSWKRAHAMEPHGLKLQGVNGKWRFALD